MARHEGRLPLITRGLAILALAPGFLAAQGPPERENPLDRLNYFYRQRAYPFEKIPPNALQRARASYRARWPAAIPSQRMQVTASTEGWAALGPSAISDAYRSAGRVTTVAIDPTNSNTIYAGAAQGGVWKTVNGGADWTPLTDAQCSLAMGALAVDPITPSIVYAGTGEMHFSLDSYYGCGVLRSSDGGVTWTQLGGAVFDTPTGGAHISKIVVDPATAGSASSSTVFAATSFGLYKSVNSGGSWSQLFAASVTDVIQDPSNHSVLFAAVGCFLSSCDPRVKANGVYKSIDGGATWNGLSGGFPSSNVGRVQLAISASSPSILYSAVADAFYNGVGNDGALLGLFKSTDAGATWTSLSHAGEFCSNQCWYDLVISVDPTDPNVVYVGGVGLYRSTDGGATFGYIGGPTHPDQHALAFDPRNPATIFVGNDGGVYKSTDRGLSWASLNTNLAITQFYPGISLSPNSSPDILGGTQDNGTVEYTGASVWSLVLGGDGGFTAIDFQTPTTAYAELEWIAGYGGPRRRRGGTGGFFSPKANGIDFNETALFIPPLVMDPVTPQVLYFGTSRLYRTVDNAESWTSVSGAFDGFDRAVSAIAVAPGDPQTIYVGMNDGTVHVTTNAAATWTLENSGLPGRYVTDIAVASSDPQRAYVTVSGFGSGHVFRTVNRGGSWQDISSNLIDVPVNAILRLPGSDELYVGTDLGVFQSGDDGLSWAPSTTGMPNVAVLDLAFQNVTQTIVAATHGRGMFAHTVAGVGALRGDVSLDGQVSAMDAQGILTGVAGLPLPSGWIANPNGDANCDGRTAALDAQIVLSFVVGLPTSQFCVGQVR